MIPKVHAEKSAERFGGKPEDYMDIHVLMDSTKGAFSDNRHRAITHNSWFTTNILPLIFGQTRVNSDGKEYNVKDVGEYHVMVDFRMKFIPTVQDYLENMRLEPWMQNGDGIPNSAKMLYPVNNNDNKSSEFIEHKYTNKPFGWKPSYTVVD